MDKTRIYREFTEAERTFALLELRSTTDGAPFVRIALQTTNKKQYVSSIRFPDSYPNAMPRVYIDAPVISYAPHRYTDGNICYMHHAMWNPGLHNLTFVIGRAAKWLNKYEVWLNNGGVWPGAELQH
jgi:hypothetical protein